MRGLPAAPAFRLLRPLAVAVSSSHLLVSLLPGGHGVPRKMPVDTRSRGRGRHLRRLVMIGVIVFVVIMSFAVDENSYGSRRRPNADPDDETTS